MTIIRMCASVRETDWSIEIAELIVTTEWQCANCQGTFNLTGIQKLQHMNGRKLFNFKNVSENYG